MAGITSRYLESLKPIGGKRQEVADDLVRGLSLRVTERGVKTWALRYRTASGQQRRLTLGAFPALSMSKAREKATKALGEVAGESDPAREKQHKRRAARLARTEKPQTLAALWTIYEAEHLPGKRERTRDYLTWLWTRHLERRLGDHELATIDRATVRVALREIGKTAPATANRALALLRHMLNLAVDNEFLAASPLAKLGPLFEETSRERVLSDAELKAFWKALNAAPARADVAVSARMAAAIKLVLLTAARPGDVAGMAASEIDATARSWTVPPERTKSGRAHVVPLSPEAWKQVRLAYGREPKHWRGPAFPNSRKADKAMERHSLTRAMARVVAEVKLPGAEKTIPRATPHDLRRTAATYLASERVGVAPHVVSAVLGHASEGPAVTATYNRHRYDKEKRAALEAWAKLLMEIVEGRKRASNVTPLRAQRKTS